MDIQKDIKPEDVDKVIADLAKLGYKVEKEETKEEKELRRLEEILTRIDPGVEPTDEELFAWAKNEHPHYMDKWMKKDIEDRIKQLKDKK